jgi:phosphotriesterase-related protein
MERSEDATAEIFVHEIEQGIGNTSVRAGVIKVANDIEGIGPLQERVLRAAARASKRTGCPINTHSNSSMELGAEQVRIFQEEGVQMDRVSIGHTADSTDLNYLERLLNAGVYLTMDRYPGRNPTWEQRNATVKALIDRGWGNRIMLGHDGWAAAWVWAGREAPRGGTSAQFNPDGMLFVSRKAIPALQKDGVSSQAIDLMTRENPRRFLTGED